MHLRLRIHQGLVRLVSLRIETVGWVLFGGIAFGILGLSYLQGSTFGYSDERDYVELARELVRGNGYSLQGHQRAFRPPASGSHPGGRRGDRRE